MPERRIPASDFWKIIDLQEDLKDAAQKYLEWRKKYVKEHDRFLDEVDFLTGLLLRRKPDGTYKFSEEMAVNDRDEAWAQAAKITNLGRDIDTTTYSVARKFGIRPDQIDLKAGIVKDADFEIIKVPEKKEKTCDE